MHSFAVVPNSTYSGLLGVAQRRLRHKHTYQWPDFTELMLSKEGQTHSRGQVWQCQELLFEGVKQLCSEDFRKSFSSLTEETDIQQFLIHIQRILLGNQATVKKWSRNFGALQTTSNVWLEASCSKVRWRDGLDLYEAKTLGPLRSSLRWAAEC